VEGETAQVGAHPEGGGGKNAEGNNAPRWGWPRNVKLENLVVEKKKNLPPKRGVRENQGRRGKARSGDVGEPWD